MSEEPGNADVPVGNYSRKNADEDVGPPSEWYTRGYLPHRNARNFIQSITFRLADSLPQEKLKTLTHELAGLTEDERKLEQRKKIERWLDLGMGSCVLGHPNVARYVQTALLHFHRERYALHAWCIMPNHVHVLVEPLADLSVIVQGWKSYTARWILKQDLLPSDTQHVWMREYWDRYIRNEDHYQRTVDYIHQNPVKAGLCSTSEAWLWSSAHPGIADVPVGCSGE